MSYSVKEIYATLQGEGFHTGRPAVLLRFSGCNLWTGREADRADAICNFCDTDFVGTDGRHGGRYHDAGELVRVVVSEWEAAHDGDPYVVLTGGEPLLQVDHVLTRALHGAGFEVALETNGTLPVSRGVDWICVSPKARSHLKQRSGDELKLVYPQEGIDPAAYEPLRFDYFFLQPMDGRQIDRNTEAAFEYCREHPGWRVSIQTHKFLGIR